MNGFPERLKGLRKNKNKTLKEVADDTGISRTVLVYYEKGQRTPGAKILYKFCKYYGVSSDYLLGIENDLSDYERLKRENESLKKKIAQIKTITDLE